MTDPVSRLYEYAQRLDELSDDLGLPELLGISEGLGEIADEIPSREMPIITLQPGVVNSSSMTFTAGGVV